MKLAPSRTTLLLVAVLSSTGAARAQTFANLNFEQATLVPTYAQPEAGFTVGDSVEASAALPGWTVSYGTTPISVIWGDPTALDQTAVELVGDQYNYQTGQYVPEPGSALDGNFSVDLYGVGPGSAKYPAIAAISQTGAIPASAKSIEFLVSGGYGPEAQPTVTFDGNVINVSPLSESNGVTTMIGDVSQYADTVGVLTFSAIPTEPLPYAVGGFLEDEYNLDDISFSTQAAPEPSSWVLAVIALGSLALLRYRLEKGKRDMYILFRSESSKDASGKA